MQITTSKEAQLRFGQFSREAQKDISIVTNHGQPIFATIPVKITANIAQFIQKVNPSTTVETADKLSMFFRNLAQAQINTKPMTEEEVSAFIKQE